MLAYHSVLWCMRTQVAHTRAEKKVTKHGRKEWCFLNAGCNCCYDVKTAKPDWNTKRGTKASFKRNRTNRLCLTFSEEYPEQQSNGDWCELGWPEKKTSQPYRSSPFPSHGKNPRTRWVVLGVFLSAFGTRERIPRRKGQMMCKSRLSFFLPAQVSEDSETV